MHMTELYSFQIFSEIVLFQFNLLVFNFYAYLFWKVYILN